MVSVLFTTKDSEAITEETLQFKQCVASCRFSQVEITDDMLTHIIDNYRGGGHAFELAKYYRQCLASTDTSTLLYSWFEC